MASRGQTDLGGMCIHTDRDHYGGKRNVLTRYSNA
jgi:hypothetical protein